jgi:hypothetical protein
VTAVRALGLAAGVGALVTLAVAHPADAAGRSFSHPVHVDTTAANLTGEPSLAIGRDGTEWIVAPAGSPGVRIAGSGFGGSLAWRSRDRGRTWAFLGDYDLPSGGGDTDVAVTPNGTLYASGLSAVACSTLAVSHDGGDTWADEPLAGCARNPFLDDRQWTAVHGNDVVYTVIGDSLGSEIDLVRTDVAGSAPLLPASPLTLYAGSYQWPGTVAVDDRRATAYVGWATADNVVEASAVPDGAAVAPTPVTVARRGFDTSDSFVTDAVDAGGSVYVAWSERHPAQRQTWAMLSVSHDAGRTWSPGVRVGAASATVVYPWVTAGDPGRVTVSFYATKAAATSADDVPASAQWAVHAAFSTDGGRTFTDYRTTPTMQVGPICTRGAACAPGSRNLLDFFETAADPRGCLVIAYADNTLGGNAAAVTTVRQTGGPGLRAATGCH